MSAQEFKPGDRVRCIETWTTHVIDSGDEFTVEETARVLTGIDAGSNRVFVQGEWVPARYFEKVEPEFVVGQQVSGDDYARLPVGSVVECSSHEGPGHGPNGIDCKPLTKVSDAEWDDGGRHDATRLYDPRTLTHLGDGMADWERELLAEVDAEDKDDLYVEPEPLKEDDAVLLWARVVDAKPDSDGEVEVSLRRADGYQTSFATTYTLPEAIVRPDAGQVPPWVKPAQCTSLYLVVGEDVYIRCHNPEGHVGVHGARFSPGFKQWSGPGDGVTVEGGAS